jgi:hypothetical protein
MTKDFAIPPLRVCTDVPDIVTHKGEHADVGFRYSPMLLKLAAAHPQFDHLYHLLERAAAHQTELRYAYNLVDNSLVVVADPASEEVEKTTLDTLASLTRLMV